MNGRNKLITFLTESEELKFYYEFQPMNDPYITGISDPEIISFLAQELVLQHDGGSMSYGNGQYIATLKGNKIFIKSNGLCNSFNDFQGSGLSFSDVYHFHSDIEDIIRKNSDQIREDYEWEIVAEIQKGLCAVSIQMSELNNELAKVNSLGIPEKLEKAVWNYINNYFNENNYSSIDLNISSAEEFDNRFEGCYDIEGFFI